MVFLCEVSLAAWIRRRIAQGMYYGEKKQDL